MRRILLAFLAAVLVVSVARCTPDENHAVARVNDYRTANNVPALRWQWQLYDKARAQAEAMADRGTVFHSDLSSGAPDDWQLLGENVGAGGDVDEVFDAFEHSPEHRANTLDPAFTDVAVGIVVRDGLAYIAVEFAQLP